jgi:hypothetical protein
MTWSDCLKVGWLETSKISRRKYFFHHFSLCFLIIINEIAKKLKYWEGHSGKYITDHPWSRDTLAGC